jgi:hypothetical protein
MNRLNMYVKDARETIVKMVHPFSVLVGESPDGLTAGPFFDPPPTSSHRTAQYGRHSRQQHHGR